MAKVNSSSTASTIAGTIAPPATIMNFAARRVNFSGRYMDTPQRYTDNGEPHDPGSKGHPPKQFKNA